jgi:hypothetical protein
MNFKDATLFRQAALVGGDWIEVRSDNAIAVDNPATGEVIVFRAMYPFVALQVCGLLLCIYFPGISLWLPRLAGFLE